MPLTMGVESPTHSAEFINGDLAPKLPSNAAMLAPYDTCVHDIILQQCESYPDSPAIDAWDGKLTYGELRQQSSQLTETLVQRGIGPEDVVPLYLNKSIWTGVAILAVLKAGGAFLLLDPALPLNRLREMCTAVKASLILTSTSRAGQAKDLLSSGSVIPIDDESMGAVCSDDTNDTASCTSVKPGNACYVVFTSGSTGKPKGIVMPHRAIATSVKTVQKPLFLQRDSRVLQFASHSFDASVYDYLYALSAGACLCVPSEASRQSALSDAFIKFSITWAILTPSVARILDPTRLQGLKTLLLAGEVITRADLDRWAPHVHLLGLYGPAEFAHAVTIRDFKALTAEPANMGFSYTAGCWVVDPDDYERLMPDGEEGELVIEGPCVSRGYIHASTSSLAAFLKNVSWMTSTRSANNQLYRTGDMVRYNQDKSLHFCGRKDTQIKLSGQRIELGEVEYHVRKALPEAGEVVVEVVSSAQGTASLVAFIQMSPSWNSSSCIEVARDADFRTIAVQARDSLKQQVPSYMVPREFLQVHHIPVTATDKTDRKALRQAAEKVFTARSEKAVKSGTNGRDVSVTPAAETLRLLCEKVLGTDLQTLPNDMGWLQLGGDSLLAMKLSDRARNYGMNVTVPDVLGVESLAQLATLVKPDEANGTSWPSNPFCLLPDDNDKKQFIIRSALTQCQVSMPGLEDLYPCTAQQMIQIPYCIKGQTNITMRMKCLLPADIDQTRLIRAWNYVTASHTIFRTRIIEAGEGVYYQAVVREPGALDLETDLVEFTNAPVVDLFGMGVPLVRGYLCDNIFVMSMHHLVMDGYSFVLNFRHLEQAYNGLTLPCTSFNPYMQWSTQMDEQDKQYWSNALAGFEGKHFPAVPPVKYLPIETATLEKKLSFSPGGDFTPSNKLRLAIAVAFARNLGTSTVVYGDLLSRRAGPIADVTELPAPTAGILPAVAHIDIHGTLRSNLARLQTENAERLNFEGVDKTLIRRINAEAANACDYQTVVVIQPIGTDTFAGIFKNATTAYGHAVGLWSLCLESILMSDSIHIRARIDEHVVSKERVAGFLDCVEIVFNAINQDPDSSPADVKANFEF